ncbi:Uncharacterized protein APZ42_019409 [Daphnia magna]|uniref:Uncharacterized protein n=1 Tax=Daphnia magna TaxID=35525 RepID=A0A164Y5D2_9CRUS|nr:Uncharacterized protein APZ42_019409 [Daphnia magna]
MHAHIASLLFRDCWPGAGNVGSPFLASFSSAGSFRLKLLVGVCSETGLFQGLVHFKARSSVA